MGYTLNFSSVWANFDSLLWGLVLGLFMAVCAIGIGFLIGIFGAFASQSKSPWVRGAIGFYVSILRNLPLLVLILFVYFGLPQLGMTLGRLESFIGALAIYAGAYLIEVLRAGLMSVPPGVVEAGRAVGLTQFQTNLYVVTPIMLRNALPAMSSTFISLFKDTSLAAIVAIGDLTYQARKINVETFRVVETWTVASLLYIATCVLIAAGLRALERRYPRF
ncbi:MAG: amino acid ABC transporter permease [Henriciella sp.]|nr:amino acid ABC transporter permease [Henriciella sp.]